MGRFPVHLSHFLIARARHEEMKIKMCPGRLKPWPLTQLNAPSWSRDGPLRLVRAVRVSSLAIQEMSEKLHRSTSSASWWFQFCLFLILPEMFQTCYLTRSSKGFWKLKCSVSRHVAGASYSVLGARLHLTSCGRNFLKCAQSQANHGLP